MGIQLYPPIIPATLDAMYFNNNGNGLFIKIPFEFNRAISASQIQNFQIQIKTPFTNKILGTYYVKTINDYSTIDLDIQTMIQNRTVECFLSNIPELIIGEYYKIQLAFVNVTRKYKATEDHDVVSGKHYYRYDTNTNKYILVTDPTGHPDTLGYYEEDGWDVADGIMSSVATTKYTVQPEVSIKDFEVQPTLNPFNYFVQGIYDNSKDLTETRSEYCFELFEDNENSTLYQSSGWLIRDPDKEQDEYTFQDIKGCTTYKLKYSVKTINNLIVESPLYYVEQAEVASDIETDYDVVVENNFNNGYVIARIQPKITLSEDPIDVDGMFRLLRKSSLEDRFIEVGRKHIVLNADNNHINQIEDFLIEQGETYEYAIQQYNEQGIYSIKKPDIATGETPAIITADFEDSFLWDGKKQLKLKFNPKISSFKINRQEQKMETSGSQFPFFTRNGKIAYHELPISGLISYWVDDEQLFMSDEELGLITPKNEPKRSQTEHIIDDEQPSSGLNYRTRQLEGYNFAAERRFKNKVLEWLGNGKPKFFKSPQEGNFIVRIMNVSLSPEDKLSRMLHTFSATAYEFMEINSKNLLENKFYKNYENNSFIGTGRVFNKIIEIKKLNSNIQPICFDPDEIKLNGKTKTATTSKFEDAVIDQIKIIGNISQLKIKKRIMQHVNYIDWNTNIDPANIHVSNVVIYPAVQDSDFTLKFKDNQDNNISINLIDIYNCTEAFSNQNNYPSEFIGNLNMTNYKSFMYLNPDYITITDPDLSAAYFKLPRYRLILATDSTLPYITFKKDQQIVAPYFKFNVVADLNEQTYNANPNTYYIQEEINNIINYKLATGAFNDQATYYTITASTDTSRCTVLYLSTRNYQEGSTEYTVKNLQTFFETCVSMHATLYFEVTYYNNYKAIYDLSSNYKEVIK